MLTGLNSPLFVTNARDGTNRLFVVEQGGIITLGGKYGWRIWEGTHCTGNDPGLCNPAGFIFPIAETSCGATA